MEPPPVPPKGATGKRSDKDVAVYEAQMEKAYWDCRDNLDTVKAVTDDFDKRVAAAKKKNLKTD